MSEDTFHIVHFHSSNREMLDKWVDIILSMTDSRPSLPEEIPTDMAIPIFRITSDFRSRELVMLADLYADKETGEERSDGYRWKWSDCLSIVIGNRSCLFRSHDIRDMIRAIQSLD